ncbi:MAG: XrtA/PEP-CTERM system TPR-repeat protein PrsT [Pseudomonadota bacterium]
MLSQSAAAQTNFDTADGYYEDASRRISDGDIAAAIIQLRNALSLDNGHMPSMLSLGKLLLVTGDSAEAILVLNDALLLGVEPAQVIPTLADAYLSAREFSELLRTFDPSNVSPALRAEVYAARAQALLATGRTLAGKTMLDNAQALNPDLFRVGLAEVTYHLQREDLDAALAVTEGLIRNSPRDTRSWSSHASVFHAGGRLSEAVEAYEQAIDVDERNVDARVSLIDLLMETRRDALAATHIEYLRETFPREPRAVYYSALSAARSGDPEKESAELALASSLFAALEDQQLRTNPQLLMLAALSNFGAESYEVAINYIESYLQLRSQDPGAIRLKASALLVLGKSKEAVRTLLPQNRRDPRDLATTSLLAAAYRQEGNHVRAEELLLSISRAGYSTEQFEQQLAFTRLNAGALDAGIADLERLRDKNPELTGIDAQLALAYLRRGRADDALSLLDQLSQSDREKPAIRNLRAMSLAQTGDRSSAADIWTQIRTSDTVFAEATLNLALLFMQDGRYEEASSLLREILAADTESTSALTLEAKIRLRMGRPEEALRSAEVALTLEPDNDEAAWQVIRSLIALEKPDEATEAARKFSARNTDSLSAYAILARTFEITGQPSQARLVYIRMARKPDLSARDLFRIAYFQRNSGAVEAAETTLIFALGRDDQLAAARTELASVQLELEKFRLAEETALRQLELTPANRTAWRLLGEAQLAQGSHRDAIVSLNRSVELGDIVPGSISLYRAKMAAGDVKGAEDALRRGSQSASGNPRLQAALTDLLISEERWTEAEKELTALLTLTPGSPAHYNNRAYVRQMLGQLDEAEEDARRALQLVPDYAAANDTLGWILAEAGRPDEALSFLRQATARMGSNNSVRFHLARVLADLGRTKESLAELYVMLESDDDFPEKSQAVSLQKELQNL